MLGNIIQSHDRDVYEAVERLRPMGRQWRKENPAALNEMVKEVKAYSPAKLLGVSRAFTHFLALSNSAENHHRIRRLRDGLKSSKYGLSPKGESSAGAIDRLVNTLKISKDTVLSSLSSQSVEIVLTAHPTEVNRKTMLQKHQRIKEILESMDRSDLIPFEQVKLAKELSRRATGRTLYILDEPTTGLHFSDIEKLLTVLERLVEAGNTVLVVEHNLEVISAADWVIDMGPEAGDGGGRIVAAGPPEDIAIHAGRFTKQSSAKSSGEKLLRCHTGEALLTFAASSGPRPR
jgi:hypothetical protein